MFRFSILFLLVSKVLVVSSERSNAYPEIVELCRGTKDDYIDISKLKISHLKNGTYGFVGGISLKKDIPNSATVSVRLLKKNSSGVWTSGFLMASPDINVCTYVAVDTLLFPMLTRTSTLPHKCPFLKGEYAFNSSDFKAPTTFGQQGCFKAVITLKEKQKSIVCLNVVAKLVGEKGSRLPRCL